MNNLEIAAVIPARMASTRYPGKPLIEIEGLPMIEHVRRRVLLCDKFSDVVVATCDNEIKVAIEEYGGTVIMTSDRHIMASDRVAEAVEILDCSHVINVQGDEILVMPDDLERMVVAIYARPEIEYWNAIAPIEKHVELEDTAIVNFIFNSGALCTLSVSDTIVGPWSYELTAGENPAYPITNQSAYYIGGTLGSVQFPNLKHWYNKGERSWWKQIYHDDMNVRLSRFTLINQVDHFCDVVKRKTKPKVTGEDGLQSLKIFAAITKSAKTGKKVKI